MQTLFLYFFGKNPGWANTQPGPVPPEPIGRRPSPLPAKNPSCDRAQIIWLVLPRIIDKNDAIIDSANV
jgi:hypothetical protein